MKNVLFILFVLSLGLLFSPSGEAADRQLRETHIENTCDTCHVGQTDPVQAGQISCKGCHLGPDKVAQKTEALGKRNPHTSPHWGTTTPCWMCHKEHTADVNYCLTCHMWEEGGKK